MKKEVFLDKVAYQSQYSSSKRVLCYFLIQRLQTIFYFAKTRLGFIKTRHDTTWHDTWLEL